ncbi:thymidylate kinase [Methanocalculus chunghsingensis]|uniref:Probable thymidylate kinase n=1 Tax=Methanocalculus chunghsingensis TaxID=156457 RepID=A0A8J7W9Y4_9EURY|nr:dTMP kinase [Methanocalculus chunghsingensis]MBR1368883.1 thymidylate kinase [Methanocalculus chunghsingensis]
MLITIEGIDGAGKSTLLASLKKELADCDPIFTREPGATWIGQVVRQAIAEEVDPVAEALLFVADHAMHCAAVIRPALDAGRLVISDRYTDSRFAYQQVTLRGHLQDPRRWLAALHEGWSIRPDLTFLLVLPVHRALERLDGENTREHFEREEVLTEVQAEYLARAGAEPSRFILVDAEEERGVIASFVAEEIRRVCELRGRYPRS